MKVAPVSADLLIKLALGALVVGGVVWVARKAINAIPSPGDVLHAAGQALDTVNPVPAILDAQDQYNVSPVQWATPAGAAAAGASIGAQKFWDWLKTGGQGATPAAEIGPGATDTGGQILNWGF